MKQGANFNISSGEKRLTFEIEMRDLKPESLENILA